MKKISTLLFLVFSIAMASAQVQRVKPGVKPADTSSAVANNVSGNKESKKEMMRELNLTKEQKSKLKEIKQANKAKTEQVMNDEKLSADEKKAQLKALHTAQLKNTLAVLNDEQKATFKQLRMQRQKQGKADPEMTAE